ncbi:protein kinase [Aeoliella sp. ICT_H6.2]|uniref:Protein kinase n=1 Tax=Aeoliella straminimaris TaxID=2954799 RepID=A0A9X2FGU8_9BACT|nr:serine/threonine-protein kinase [Aeoliella straminimaris]MCO6044071.1 protein kinase [Aeoliella straminimaris]
MVQEKNHEQAVFEEARNLDSAADRDAYLSEICGEDQEFRSRVEDLLRVYDEDTTFLESPPEACILDRSIAEQPGDTIGPYKLLQQIGEGGMGVVYMAEQTAPVERRVALKIIKPGMDTRQVIARFEAERQALAMMDHPNIAKVLEAGTTAAGLPYFVMELVKGVPITEYCDQQQLDPRQRLELFIPVCQAVQHAHQKGIIHRDIKPSNVLVARYDGQAIPKIIDFGVAKATQQRLTEKTLFTEFGQVVGTMEYMSPEQAEFNQMDIDTRTDIYSLGVLLYELLAGETPFERERLRSAAFDEMLRIIREDEPPRPSVKLSTSQSLASIAADRQLEPSKLGALVRGELDWIVMKAIEKDRARRYETASDLAEDVQRYLSDEPVEACPPSSIYLVGKFTRRNRGWLSTTAVVLLIAFVGLGASTYLIAQERDAAEESARREAIAAEEADRERQRAEQNLRQSRAAVDRLFTRAAEELVNVPHMTEVRRALLEDAAEFYEGFLQQKSADPEIRKETALAYQRLGFAYEFLGRYGDAVAATQKAASMYEQLADEFPAAPDYRIRLADSLNELAVRLRRSGHPNESVAMIRRSLQVAERLASEHPTVVRYRRKAARLPVDAANQGGPWPATIPERVDLCRLSLARWLQFREDFPHLKMNPWEEGHSHHWLASNLMKIGEYEEAEQHLRLSRDIRQQLLDRFPNDAWARARLGHVEIYLAQALLHRGAAPEAEQNLRSAIEGLGRLKDDFPDVDLYRKHMSLALRVLAEVLIAQGRLEEAEDAYLGKIAQQTKRPGDDAIAKRETAWTFYDLGLLQHYQGKTQAAADSFRLAFEGFESALSKSPGTSHQDLAKSALRWTRVACPMSPFRAAETSITYSNEALQRAPESPDYWNSLGIGHYRAGDFDEAITALDRSIEFGGEDDMSNYYFLAMAHWRRGEQDEARQSYGRGVEKQEAAGITTLSNLELASFRREAEEVLGIDANAVDQSSTNAEVR